MNYTLILIIILSPSIGWTKIIRGSALNIYIENDSRDMGGPGSDNAYTSGIKISYISAENTIPVWAKPFKNILGNSASNFGFSLGHQIYTPNDIRTTALILDDRPYAAWLYFGLSAHFQNEKASHSFELDVGVIGPEAGGERVQNNYHQWIGKYHAKGWEHQLNTEPTLQLSYQQRFRIFKSQYMDTIPFVGGGLGNVAVDLHAGAMLRMGIHLPEDYGPTRPSLIDGDNFVKPMADGYPQSSIYGFVAGRGIAVGHNIFLDGNTFRSSHSVKRNPFLVETELGIAGMYQHWSLAWRFVTRSPEFAERSVVNSFASISIAYVF